MLSKIERLIINLNNNLIATADLTGERLSEENAKNIASALAVNTSLERLVLGGIVVGCDLQDHGVIHFAHALIKNKSLVHLDLRANGISDLGVKKLVNALFINKTLASLDLRFNVITENGVELIADLLKERNNMLAVFI